MKELAVAYSADDKYAHFLGISMQSLLDSQTTFDKITVFALDCGITEENKSKLRKIADRDNAELVFCPVEDKLKELGLALGNKEWFIAAYARLFMGDIIPEKFDRIIYLDGDTIVTDSLEKMWNVDFGDNLIAGVQDTVDKYYLNVIGLSENTKYINTGVLVINLTEWRKQEIKNTFVDVIRQFNGNVPHHDQGIINCACKEKRIILPIRYNLTSNNFSFSASTVKKIYFIDDYYSQQEVDEAKQRPAIIHFTMGLLGRPWEEGCSHPLRDEFWNTVAKTPWEGLEPKKDSRKKSLKMFTFVYNHIPLKLFEFLYCKFCFLLHK